MNNMHLLLCYFATLLALMPFSSSASLVGHDWSFPLRLFPTYYVTLTNGANFRIPWDAAFVFLLSFFFLLPSSFHLLSYIFIQDNRFVVPHSGFRLVFRSIMAFKSWADGPYPLIETPSKTRPLKVRLHLSFHQNNWSYTFQTSHYSVHVATEMAHTHNSFLRSLNSIYHQAPNVSFHADIRDLLLYCTFWHNTVEHHHNSEETVFFSST